jgi:hypothetical protein
MVRILVAILQATEEAHKNAAATFTRLVTESCAQQTQAAFKAGGTKAMSNRDVSAFDKYIDKDKLNQVLSGKRRPTRKSSRICNARLVEALARRQFPPCRRGSGGAASCGPGDRRRPRPVDRHQGRAAGIPASGRATGGRRRRARSGGAVARRTVAAMARNACERDRSGVSPLGRRRHHRAVARRARRPGGQSRETGREAAHQLPPRATSQGAERNREDVARPGSARGLGPGHRVDDSRAACSGRHGGDSRARSLRRQSEGADLAGRLHRASRPQRDPHRPARHHVA